MKKNLWEKLDKKVNIVNDGIIYGNIYNLNIVKLFFFSKLNDICEEMTNSKDTSDFFPPY